MRRIAIDTNIYAAFKSNDPLDKHFSEIDGLKIL